MQKREQSKMGGTGGGSSAPTAKRGRPFNSTSSAADSSAPSSLLGPTFQIHSTFADQNYKRIVLALQSGLKSELNWALNTLSLLSFKEKEEVRKDATPLAKINGLLDALLQIIDDWGDVALPKELVRRSRLRLLASNSVVTRFGNEYDALGSNDSLHRPVLGTGSEASAQKTASRVLPSWLDEDGLFNLDEEGRAEKQQCAVAASNVIRYFSFMPDNETSMAQHRHCLETVFQCIEEYSTSVLFQLSYIRRLEGDFPSMRRVQEIRTKGFHDLVHDKEATLLRLGYVKPEIVSWSPRIIVLHNFLSMEECDYLRTLSRSRLKVSTVVDAKTGKGIKSDVRTSSGMFLMPAERTYPMIKAIEKRISVFAQVPIEHGESLQVLRYEKSQFYRPHRDYFSDTYNVKLGGQRVATVLMYLSDNVEGGETYFPMAGSGDCTCGGKIIKGLSVKPIKGDAVLFWSMGLDGQSDPKSLHGGCEVLSGEKWSATKWMRQKPLST